jgi:hypothetical protein
VIPGIPEVQQQFEPNEVHQPRLTLLRTCGYLLFFLMLFVPTTYQPVKLGLLVICLVAIATAKPSIQIQVGFARTTVLLASIGALEILYGTLRGNDGAYPQITVWVLWPLVFLLLSSAISTEQHLRSLFRVMVAASIAIGVYGCLYMLTLTGHIPAGFYSDKIDQGQSIYYESGVLAISLYSFSSLLFLGPFLVALVITWPRDRSPVVRSYWIYLGIVLNVALGVLSGRRALLLGFALTPIILILATRVSRARLVRVVVPSIALCSAALLAVRALHIDVGATLDFLTTGYKSAGDNARQIEFQSLMDGWRENPIFGAGLGAVANGPVRSIETPWAYELSYVALLFNIGIVGVLIYGTVIGTIIRRTVAVARARVELRPWTIPVLVGMAGSLIGNATNPYLLKFDSMWVWFLPVALLNVNAVQQQMGCQPTTEHPPNDDLKSAP